MRTWPARRPSGFAAFVGAPTAVLFSRAGVPAQAAPRGPGGEWPVILHEPSLADLSAERVAAAIDAMLADRESGRCCVMSRADAP